MSERRAVELIHIIVLQMNFMKNSKLKHNLIWYLGLFTIFFLIIEKFTGKLYSGTDIIEQYAAAKALISGFGLNTYHINVDDLSSPLREPLTKWPPGFSIISSIGFLFTDNVQTQFLALSLLNILIFFYGVVKLIQLLVGKLSKTLVFFILLFLCLHHLYTARGIGTDLICLNLFLYSSIFLIQYHQNNRIEKLFLACLFMVLTVYFRYAYFPAILALPGFYFIRLLFFNTKEWKPFYLSILFTLISAIPVIGHILFINSKTGYIQEKSPSLSFYWENLLSVNPFPLHGFIETFSILRLLGYSSSYGYDRGYEYPFYIDIVFYVVSVIIIIPVVYVIRKNHKRNIITSPVSVFLLFGVITSMGLIILIYYGSVTNPSQVPEFNWSWVKVPRYYIIPIIFIQISYLIILFTEKAIVYNRLILIIFSISIFLLMIRQINIYSKDNYHLFDYKFNAEFYTQIPKLNSHLTYLELPKNPDSLKVLLVDKGFRAIAS